MFGIDNYPAFIAAGILLNIMPGSDTIYILTRSMSQGKKAGIYSVLGISAGGLGHTLLAALGLSVLLCTSPLLFNIVKYAGVIYLIYIGLRTIISKEEMFNLNDSESGSAQYKKIFRQGVLTNLLNPKVALFFISFLPQFINTGISSGPLPFLILGVTLVLTGAVWFLILVYFSSALTDKIRKKPALSGIIQKISGSVFIGMGLTLALNRK